MFSLKDKVALVTGASQGIGRATSLSLAQAGAKIAVAARNVEKLGTLVAEYSAGQEAYTRSIFSLRTSARMRSASDSLTMNSVTTGNSPASSK